MNIGICYKIKSDDILMKYQAENGTAVISGAEDFYFENNFLALKVKFDLSKKNKDYKFNFIQLPDEIAKKKILIESYDQYLNLVQENKIQSYNLNHFTKSNKDEMNL